ncbi:hypothetical protein BVX98_00930, partial [bacterium F11]
EDIKEFSLVASSRGLLFWDAFYVREMMYFLIAPFLGAMVGAVAFLLSPQVPLLVISGLALSVAGTSLIAIRSILDQGFVLDHGEDSLALNRKLNPSLTLDELRTGLSKVAKTFHLGTMITYVTLILVPTLFFSEPVHPLLILGFAVVGAAMTYFGQHTVNHIQGWLAIKKKEKQEALVTTTEAENVAHSLRDVLLTYVRTGEIDDPDAFFNGVPKLGASKKFVSGNIARRQQSNIQLIHEAFESQVKAEELEGTITWQEAQLLMQEFYVRVLGVKAGEVVGDNNLGIFRELGNAEAGVAHVKRALNEIRDEHTLYVFYDPTADDATEFMNGVYAIDTGSKQIRLMAREGGYISLEEAIQTFNWDALRATLRGSLSRAECKKLTLGIPPWALADYQRLSLTDLNPLSILSQVQFMILDRSLRGFHASFGTLRELGERARQIAIQA